MHYMYEREDMSKLTYEESEELERAEIEEVKQILASNKDLTNIDMPSILYTSDANIQYARKFLERGANPNELNCTTNRLAVESTCLLLEFKADPNYRGHNNSTPLHELGTTFNNLPGDIGKKIFIAKLLLKNKAQLHIKDKNGNTPFEIALNNHYCYEKEKSYWGFGILAKLFNSESRYRLFVEIESARAKKLLSPFNMLPKDMIKMIVLLAHPQIKPPVKDAIKKAPL